MEFSSTPSKTASRHRRKARRLDFDLFSSVVAQYAADTPPTDGGDAGLDPTNLQEGQSVFDNEGNEQVIVGNPDDTSGKVLMPKDQVDMGAPGGAYNVEDAELATTYSLQSPVGSYNDPYHGFDPKTHLPDGIFKGADIVMDLGDAGNGGLPSLDTTVKNDSETDGFRIGQPGYMEIIDNIKAMRDCGYETVDIVLNVGELYDRDLGERVLAEARRKGII